MRTHDRSTGRTEAPTTRRPPPATDTPADRIRAPQRAAGNAGVAELIQRQHDTVHGVLNEPGEPLAEPVRQDMEARLGANLSDVRMHTGTAAQRSAQEIGARAYTSGSHVVTGPNGGDAHALADELTHVLQQRAGEVPGVDNGSGLLVSEPTDRFEQAEAVKAFRDQVTRHWYSTLRRRSQRTRITWPRMRRFAKRWLPPACTMHPYPDVRFAARTQGRSPAR